MTNDSFKQAGTSIICFSFFLCATTPFWTFIFNFPAISLFAYILLISGMKIREGSRPATYSAMVFSLLYVLVFLTYMIISLSTDRQIKYGKYYAQPGSIGYFALLVFYLAIVIWSSLNCYQLYKAIKSPLERSI